MNVLHVENEIKSNTSHRYRLYHQRSQFEKIIVKIKAESTSKVSIFFFIFTDIVNMKAWTGVIFR